MNGLSPALFVSAEPVPKDVTLPDGTTHTLHFKQLPASAFRRYYIATQSKDETAQSDAMGVLIASCLCDESGKAVLSVKQALQLTPAAENAISKAVLEVNGLGADAGNA